MKQGCLLSPSHFSTSHQLAHKKGSEQPHKWNSMDIRLCGRLCILIAFTTTNAEEDHHIGRYNGKTGIEGRQSQEQTYPQQEHENVLLQDNAIVAVDSSTSAVWSIPKEALKRYEREKPVFKMLK